MERAQLLRATHFRARSPCQFFDQLAHSKPLFDAIQRTLAVANARDCCHLLLNMADKRPYCPVFRQATHLLCGVIAALVDRRDNAGHSLDLSVVRDHLLFVNAFSLLQDPSLTDKSRFKLDQALTAIASGGEFGTPAFDRTYRSVISYFQAQLNALIDFPKV